MVEFVIALPVMLLLLLATIELGRGFMQYNTMVKTIRDGAGFAAKVARTSAGTTGLVTFDAGDIGRIRNLVVHGNVAGTGPTVLPGLSTTDVDVTSPGGGDIAVNISYDYQPLFLRLPKFGSGGDINVSNFQFQNRVTMRVL